jgi:hypothetical protein
MNKEQQELLDEAYGNYCDEYWNLSSLQDKIEYGTSFYNHDTDDYTFEELTQDEFINKCKTNPEFSNKWGLTIEERELSLEERTKLAKGKVVFLLASKEDSYNHARIPTKLITITYNNKTIESYE